MAKDFHNNISDSLSWQIILGELYIYDNFRIHFVANFHQITMSWLQLTSRAANRDCLMSMEFPGSLFFGGFAFLILVTPEGFLYLPLIFPTKKVGEQNATGSPGNNHWWWDSRGVNSGRPMLRWQDRGRPCRLCRWCRACGLIVPSRKGWMCKLKKRDSIYCTCYWWYIYI